VVGFGHTAHHAGTDGPVLVGNPICASPNEAGGGHLSASGGLWYRKAHPTFADALASVRKELRAQEEQTFCGLPAQGDTIKVPRAFVERLTEAVCYAA
jgi:hypothetical protein